MEKYYISSNKANIQERTTKLNGKVYDIVFRVTTLDGKSKQKRLSGYKTKALAKQAHIEFINKHCELLKDNPAIKQKAADAKTYASKTELTVNALFPLYISALHGQNKESTICEKLRIFKFDILPTLGTAKITELTKQRLYAWQDELWNKKSVREGKQLSSKYLSTIRTQLSSFLTWVENRYDLPNNLRSVKKPKTRVSKTEMQFWTRAEFDKFIEVVDNPTYRAIFAMLFFTGRRKGEVIALSDKDVLKDKIVFSKTYSRKTLSKGTYTITFTKNEKKDSTIICEPLKKELANYTPQSPFYFGGENPISDNTLYRIFNRYIAKSGVKRIRMHDLRHSFVSMCIHLGASVYVVASLIGDTPEQILKTYGHLYESDKANIIAKIV